MTIYRFYFISPNNVMFDNQSHDCTDEMAATTMARRLCTNGHIEIWDGTRKVATVGHETPSDDSGRTRR